MACGFRLFSHVSGVDPRIYSLRGFIIYIILAVFCSFPSATVGLVGFDWARLGACPHRATCVVHVF